MRALLVGAILVPGDEEVRYVRSKGVAMLYYTVTEGRARALDRLNLRDRATYGLDWMVFEATTARDAVRQWGLFKAGTHPHQDDLEVEATSYRAGAPGYAAPWEAELEAVRLRAVASLQTVKARSQALREEQADLEQTRESLSRLVSAARKAATRATPKRRRRSRKTRNSTTKRRKSTTDKKRKAKQPQAGRKRRQPRQKGR